MTESSETTSRAIIRQAISISIAAGIFAIPIAAAASVLAYATIGAQAAMIAGASIFGAASLYVASVLMGAWSAARWVLVETIAASIEKTRAEAAKIEAEAAAIEGAAQTTIINQNAPGAIVKNKPIVYRVNGNVTQLDLHTENQIDQRTIKLDGADVRYFCEQLAKGYGHQKAKWLGQELPYSRTLVTWAIYKALIDPVADGGGIQGRGPRAAGQLVESDPAQLVRMIEAKYPEAGKRGITLELGPGNEAST